MSKITNGSMKLIKSEITDIIYSTIGTDLPSNFDKIDAGVDAVNTRVNNIITTPVDGVSAQEIIDARGGNPTLGTRLDNMQSQTDILQEEVDNLVDVGIPKLVSFDYDIQATVEGQNKFLIPYEFLSLNTDTVEVFVNGIAVPDTYYVITEPVEVESVITLGYVTLTESKPIGTIVKVRILKNVPNGDEGSVDGAMITVDSIPLNRINSTELDGFMTDSLSDINTSLNENTQNINNHKDKLVTDSNGVHGLKIESGTWTPILYGMTTEGNNTYNIQKGFYVKQGNIVNISCQIALTTKDINMNGQIRIKGLPFSNVSENVIGLQLGICYKIDMSLGHFACDILPNSNTIRLGYITTNGYVIANQSVVYDGTIIIINGSYKVA